MSESNQRTIDAYNGHIEAYIGGTPNEVSGDIQDLLAKMLHDAPKEARILEIGSAFGRDADYIESLGYLVQRTDASEEFVSLMRSKGKKVTLLNVITDEITDSYDIIYANAVLLHFTDEETRRVLNKVHAALRDGGTFTFTLKRGNGDMWSEHKLGVPRYFNLWQHAGIEQLLNQTGFKDIQIDTEQDQLQSKWLYIIAKK